MLGGNAVVHYQATFTHCLGQDFTVFAQVSVTHMLKHTDTDNFIESAILRQISVIEQLQIDLILKTIGNNTLAPQR